MGRKKKVIEPKIEEPIIEAPAIEEIAKTEFSVFTEKGDFVRTYSVEIHGEKAGELAKGYAEKIGGIIK